MSAGTTIFETEQETHIMGIKDITEADFDAEVIKASFEKPVLVEFWATWCAPCKMMVPVLEDLASQFKARIKVVKVDADTNIAVLNRFNVVNVPTMILLSGGSVVRRIHGAKPKAAMLVELEPWL
jgi:thioredoxin